MVIGIGSQQLNVGFENTLPIVKSITKSFSANCGETCRGLPCLCNFMEAQTSLSDSLAHELWKSCSILADVLVIMVLTGMQGPFLVWLMITWWLTRGKSEHLLDTWQRSDSFSWWNLLVDAVSPKQFQTTKYLTYLGMENFILVTPLKPRPWGNQMAWFAHFMDGSEGLASTAFFSLFCPFLKGMGLIFGIYGKNWPK